MTANCPKILELDWIIFDLKNSKVLSDFTKVINPGELLQNETTRVTGISQSKITTEGISLAAALS